MKHICICLILIGISSCQKQTESNSKVNIRSIFEEIPKSLSTEQAKYLKLPEGSTTEIIDKGKSVRIKFPTGIYMFGTTASGVVLKLRDETYTCTGSCSTGCDVFYAAGVFGCSACTPGTIVCTGKSGSSNLIGAGIVDLNAGIKLLTSKKDLKDLYNGPDVLFEIPEVKAGMSAFNLKNYGTKTPDFSNTSNFKEVALNLYGCAVIYLMPKNNLESRLTGEGDDKFSCSCESPANSPGCTKDSGIGYKRCVSGACTSCTMTIN